MGKLKVITSTLVYQYGNPYIGHTKTHEYYGLEDEIEGIVLQPESGYCNIQIIDDNNVFVWVNNGAGCAYTLEGRHFQRESSTGKLVEKYRYEAFTYDLKQSVTVINNDIMLINKTRRKALYSLSKGIEVTVDFKNISEFYEKDGIKVAVAEITVPEDPSDQRAFDFLYGEIDEYGNHVSDLKSVKGDAYSITDERYCIEGEFFAKKVVCAIEERQFEETLEEKRLNLIYFVPKKEETHN